MKLYITNYCIVIFGIIFISGGVSAQCTETRITQDGSDQWDPAIYEDKIVWVDYRNGGDWDIYMYDLSTSTETQITTDGYDKSSPAIYGDRIVWEDSRNDDGDIYMYDLSTSTETRITGGNRQSTPAIYGDRIVWADNRNGNSDIYMYDLLTSTETRITTDGYDQWVPSIYEDTIVWQDNRNDIPVWNGYFDIYMYDLSTSTETRLTPDGSKQYVPAIYGDRIVWSDNRNGNSDPDFWYEDYDIYMYDLSTSTETQITTANSNQWDPAIYEDKIVWRDVRNGDWDIYMYDLSTSTETRITTDGFNQNWPVIYEDKIVWQDSRNGGSDIYMCTNVLAVEYDFNSILNDFTVLPAYPNPFNPSTTIRYGLENDSNVKIEIFDATGKLISTLQNKNQTQGWHSIHWNGTNQKSEKVPAGLYLSRITSGNEVKTSKLMLLK